MPTEYFSDREIGAKPQTQEEITESVLDGIMVLVNSLISKGAFGAHFPLLCPDGEGPYGCSESDFWAAAKLEIPGLAKIEIAGLDSPTQLDLLDLLQQMRIDIAAAVREDQLIAAALIPLLEKQPVDQRRHGDLALACICLRIPLFLRLDEDVANVKADVFPLQVH